VSCGGRTSLDAPFCPHAIATAIPNIAAATTHQRIVQFPS
jgi:hypothetical protein